MRRLSPGAGLTQLLQKRIDQGRLVGFMRLISHRRRQGRAVIACRVCGGLAGVGGRGFELERHAIPSTKKCKDLAVHTFAHLDVPVCSLSITGNQCLFKRFWAQYRIKITVLAVFLLRINDEVSECHPGTRLIMRAFKVITSLS
jgi:hypothetical protein